MAIDFSQVKTITIPESEITRITDASGNVLWQRLGWNTVWEGSKKIGYGGYEGFEFLFGTAPYSDSLKLRISFSELNAYSPNGNASIFKYFPADKISPFTCDNIDSDDDILVEASAANKSTEIYYKARLYYNKITGKIYGYAGGNNLDYARAYIVITKIEAYYE